MPGRSGWTPMPQHETQYFEDPLELASFIDTLEGELAVFMRECKNPESIEASRRIAELNQRISSSSKILHAKAARSFLMKGNRSGVREHEALAEKADKSALEWGKQTSRLATQYKIDIIPRLVSELKQMQNSGSDLRKLKRKADTG